MREIVNSYSWEKFGLTYDSKTSNPEWGRTHALVPTPIVIDESTVAIFTSFIDSEFRGRVSRVDVGFETGRPIVRKIYDEPVLELGEEGSFSQFGVGLGCFWPSKIGGDLYFIGFDRPPGFKFKAFSGRATIQNEGFSYRQTKNTPLFGERFGGKTIVGVHDIIQVRDKFRVLISIGSSFEVISEKEFPRYQVHLATGTDLENLEISRTPIIPAISPTYRIGRPRISEVRDGYEIIATAGTIHGSYLPESYFSSDFVNWSKKPIENFTQKTILGFDDLHQCYLSRFTLKDQEWIVYNGNNMGIAGFGFAKGTQIEA